MWRSLGRAFTYASAGIVYALRTERNMRIHFAAIMAVLLLELILRPALGMSLTVLLAAASVIALELVNTAIERTVDMTIGTVHSILAKAAKDTAAGAVLIAACAAVMVGAGMLMTVYPWHWRLWSHVHAGAAWLNFCGWLACIGVVIGAVFQQNSVSQEDIHT